MLYKAFCDATHIMTSTRSRQPYAMYVGIIESENNMDNHIILPEQLVPFNSCTCCAEMYGILKTVEYVVDNLPEESEVEIYCDCKAAVKIINGNSTTFNAHCGKMYQKIREVLSTRVIKVAQLSANDNNHINGCDIIGKTLRQYANGLKYKFRKDDVQCVLGSRYVMDVRYCNYLIHVL